MVTKLKEYSYQDLPKKIQDRIYENDKDHVFEYLFTHHYEQGIFDEILDNVIMDYEFISEVYMSELTFSYKPKVHIKITEVEYDVDEKLKREIELRLEYDVISHQYWLLSREAFDEYMIENDNAMFDKFGNVID